MERYVSMKNYMTNHRVPNLHRMHLIVKLVRKVPHVRSEKGREIIRNIRWIQYLHCLKVNIWFAKIK